MSFFKRLFGSINKKQEHNVFDGLTETKISDGTYATHIQQKQIDNWTVERHKRDKVNELIKKDGFYDKPNGRSGTIYHVDNGRLCEIDFEISGVKQFDILVYFDSLKEWILPDKKTLTPVEKLHIKEKVLIWLDKKSIKADL